MIRDPITTTQAAMILQCTRRHVRNLVDAGELAGQRMGRDWFVSRRQVEGYTRARPGTAKAASVMPMTPPT